MVSCLVVTGRKKEKWYGRGAAGGAFLLVLGLEPAGRAEIRTNVLTAVLTVTAIVVVVERWTIVKAAAAIAQVKAVEAALHERESCPPRCSEALGCLHSRSSSHLTHSQVGHQSCLRSSTPFESVAVCT